jgi:hypothetical protein
VFFVESKTRDAAIPHKGFVKKIKSLYITSIHFLKAWVAQSAIETKLLITWTAQSALEFKHSVAGHGRNRAIAIF